VVQENSGLTLYEKDKMLRHLASKLKKMILACIAIILIVLGISMIVITAPSPKFEIATIFYFNPNDGITVTDLISLIIALSGLYMLITVLSPD
jgi:succinate dehydrogenase hydrophobic anchor subunit